MIETLYKTDKPEKEKSECCVLVVTPRPASGGKIYSFMEEHGRWDESNLRFVREVRLIAADNNISREAAFRMYHRAKQNLTTLGFTHSFVDGSPLKGPKREDKLRHTEEASA